MFRHFVWDISAITENVPMSQGARWHLSVMWKAYLQVQFTITIWSLRQLIDGRKYREQFVTDETTIQQRTAMKWFVTAKTCEITNAFLQTTMLILVESTNDRYPTAAHIWHLLLRNNAEAIELLVEHSTKRSKLNTQLTADGTYSPAVPMILPDSTAGFFE